jgi:hypothetical protein
MSIGKAGLGVYRDISVDAGGVEEVTSINGAAVLLMDNARCLAARIKSANPKTVIIARHFNADERALILTGEAGGRAYARQVYAECADADAYLPINEAAPGIDNSNPDRAGQLAQQLYWVKAQAAFEYGFVDELWTRYGKRSVIINAGPGIIPVGDVPGQLEGWATAYKRVIEHPGVLWVGVHLYGSGDDPQGRLAGGDPNWFFKRYERFYNLMRARINMRALCATEWGQTRGWRNILSEQAAGDDLLWSLEQVQDDPRIACLIDYLCGRAFIAKPGEEDKWLAFDIHNTGIPARLAAWNRAHPILAQPVQPTPPQGGGTMDIALAIFPSLQGYNAYSKYGANEAGAMAWQADQILKAAWAAGINAKAFNAPPDGPSSTAFLVQQQDGGYAWLDAQPQTLKIGLNFHTDSGADSHTWGIWTNRIDGRSRELAEKLALIVQQTLGTATVGTFYNHGGIDFNTYIFATHAHANTVPVLLELCSHQNLRDLDALWAAGDTLAKAIVGGIVAWAGQAPDLSARVRELEAQLAAANGKLVAIVKVAQG